eukprot:m.18997 g.18997  ORF g.18997 m.18997 type:complete len:239 (-) comp9805_c0_seq1:1942-2658(-)
MVRAIVTGGSSGIGRAICNQLGKRGYQVFVCGRDEANLKQVVEDVKSHGGTGSYGIGDVGDEATVGLLYSKATEFFEGPPDVLVASAGVGRFGELDTVSADDFDLSFRTNVKGVFLWMRACLPDFKAQNSGQIVVISSVAGIRVYPAAPVYCATKWAVQGMVGSVREGLKGTKVKVGTINPGAVATPWWTETERGGKETPATEEKLETMLLPEDVAIATMSIVEQSATSNIEMISLDP